jgi:hypothetical protein
LLFVQTLGSYDGYRYELVSSTVAAEAGDAFAFELEDGARLSSFRNRKLFRPVDGRNYDLIAEGRLREGDWDLAIDILVLAFEKGMLLDLKYDVEVPRWSPESSRFTFAGEAHARAHIDAGRNFEGDLALPYYLALARALRTRFGYDLTCAAALSAGAGYNEESLLVTYLPLTMTSRAGRLAGAGSGAAAVAVRAGFCPGDPDPRLRAVNCIFKAYL